MPERITAAVKNGARSSQTDGAVITAGKKNQLKKTAEKRKVGVWVDRRKAVIVTLGDKGEEIKEINLNFGRHARSVASSSKDFIGENGSDDSKDRRMHLHLNIYYDEIVLNLANAEMLFIFGPGEAKHELRKRIKNKELSKRIIGVETTDKMTDRQISAEVRRAYSSAGLDK
jgi:hypothetical protein